MDDWTFMPKKLFQILSVVVVFLAVAYTFVTGDPQKGTEFYMKEVEFISKPLINRFHKKMENIIKKSPAMEDSISDIINI